MNRIFSLYPNQLDGYSTLPLVRDLIDEIRADDVNRLRDAICKIEYELGIEPSGVFATVRARLDSVGAASTLINAHLIDPTDAHDASAISVLDAGDSFLSDDVESVLGELAATLPAEIDVIGENTTTIPNSGIPTFVSFLGDRHVFNTGAGANILKKTQPVNVTGVHIFDVGAGNGIGACTLSYIVASTSLTWQAPNDVAAGAAVDISALTTGDIVTLESSTTTKRIRIARSSAALPLVNTSDSFETTRLDAASGAFSIAGTGIKDTNFITRAASGSTTTSRKQFVITGMVYPADKGVLVLQRKLRLGSAEFAPIAVLNLSSVFTEADRATGQSVYIPTLVNYDTITLFDRQPERNDYDTLATDADDDPIYDNFNVERPFITAQVAKYMIPVSNSYLLAGTLEAPTDITAAQIENNVSAYRVVHYKVASANYDGTAAANDIYSIYDVLVDANDGDNNVRMSNLFLDSNSVRPSLSGPVIIEPVADVENIEKHISGIHYYGTSADLFNLEVATGTSVFSNSYLRTSILRFTSDILAFPSGAGFGKNIDVTQLFDNDGYNLYSNANLPNHTDPLHEQAFYFINAAYNTARRLCPEPNVYSNNASITATLYDPFGAGITVWAGGSIESLSPNPVRLLVNSFDIDKSTHMQEFFTDESLRVGSAEMFMFELDDGQFTSFYGAGVGGTLDAWDTIAPLGGTDLQVGGVFDQPNTHGLIYPQDNYASGFIRPLQSGAGVNYSAYAGNRIYQRLFNFGHTTSGGRLRIVSDGAYKISFNDIKSNNASRKVKIEVKVPGAGTNSTGWMDIGKLYSSGETGNGSGALIGSIVGGTGDFIVPFTFGPTNNADTFYFVAVRITYYIAAPGVKTVIISQIELLDP